MRRIVLLILLLVFMPNPGKPGSYNYYSNVGYCTDRLSCLHEIGHALDDASGLPSETTAFRTGVTVYLKISDFDDLYVKSVVTLLTTRQKPDRELYAWLFAWADGNIDNIPEDLQKYYDRDLAAKYLEKVDNKILIFWNKDS